MGGNKVEFKPMTRKHIQKIVQWRNDPEVAYWATGNEPVFEFTSEEEAEKSFNFHLENTSRLDAYSFAVYTLDGEFIGTADYRNVDFRKRSCTVGISIGNREFWNRGYGTDAVRLMLKYLFERLNLRRIELDTWSGNARAIRAYEKCGFQVEGRLRENEFVNGKYYDTVLMGILRKEWKEEKN